MEKINFKSLIEEVRFNSFVNSLLKMNEEQITVIASQLDEETRTRVISVLEASSLPKPKRVKVKPNLDAIQSQGVIDIMKKAGSEPSAELKADALDVKPPPGPRPAADLKAGDMRSQFAKGPPTNAGVAKADAAFKDTSKAIGARKAADKAKADAAADSASAINYPKSSMGNIKAKADTDLRTKARTDAEVKAKRDATMSDTAKKVAKGLAGAGALGAAGYLLTKDSNNQNPAQAEAPTGTKMKVAQGDTLSQIAQKNKVSVADLMKANQGIKNVHKIYVGQELNIPSATNNPVYKDGIGTKSGPTFSQNMMPKKKANEETEYSSNRLIEGFKSIMSSGSPNLFEAAKKAKKDWDRDGKIESPKDEVWGSRFRAAGIQKEESEAEKAKKNPMSHERDTASSRIPNRELTADEMPKKKVSKVVQTGKNTSTAYKVEEDVEYFDEKSFTSSQINDIIKGNDVKKNNTPSTGIGSGMNTYLRPDYRPSGLTPIGKPKPEDYNKPGNMTPIGKPKPKDYGPGTLTPLPKPNYKPSGPDKVQLPGKPNPSAPNDKVPQEKTQDPRVDYIIDRLSPKGKRVETITLPDGRKIKIDPDATMDFGIREEGVEISEARESFTKGTRKVKSYAQGDYHAEVRHNPDWQEYQVHFYKNGKHMGEGPVSYHGEDKEDAHDSAKAGLEFLNKRNNMAESVNFSDAELAHLSSIDEANPIAPVPDDYSGAAGGVSIRDLSDETVAEGIRGMRRKDSKFKDDQKKYTNEYPKSFREPGTMSKSEMRDHIEASVRRYLRSGGKINKS